MFVNATELDTAWGDFYWDKGRIDGCTLEPGEPSHGLSPGNIGKTAWFYWTAPADGVLTVDSFGSEYRTWLAVYTGASINALTPIGYGEAPNGETANALIAVPVVSGTTYRIALCAGAVNGDYYLDWEFTPSGQTPVWRFYNTANQSHFYTASPAEAAWTYTYLADTYDYDGPAYTINQYNALNNSSLWRFYNKLNGSHFYTANAAEMNDVNANMQSTYQLDGVAYWVCTSPAPGATTVWRFYNRLNGSHFYTADPAEKNNVQANLSSIYQLDGPGFYLAP